MTNLPKDPIDPGEARLAGRVRSYSDPAVVPIDALAIAHDVAARRRRGFFTRIIAPASGVARLGWIAVGALLVVAAVAGAGFAGNQGLFTGTNPATTTPVIQPTAPVATAGTAVSGCSAAQLNARITSWDGAAGSRIAMVELTNSGSVCVFPTRTQPQLIDAGGAVLIHGAPVSSSATLSLAFNGRLTTMVEVGNYCGPTPSEPVTVAFILADGGQVVALPDGRAGDVDGVPPCLGSTQPATIQAQAWQR